MANTGQRPAAGVQALGDGLTYPIVRYTWQVAHGFGLKTLCSSRLWQTAVAKHDGFQEARKKNRWNIPEGHMVWHDMTGPYEEKLGESLRTCGAKQGKHGEKN